MHVTFGEEGSWVSMAVVVLFFFLTNMGLERDLPLLLLPTLVLRNLINGGGNFSVRPGLDMGLVDNFIFIQALNLFFFFFLSDFSGLSLRSFLGEEEVKRYVWFLRLLFLYVLFACIVFFFFLMYFIFTRMGE